MIGALELGLLYGVMALGVYLTFRILNFADLTVDGSFHHWWCYCCGTPACRMESASCHAHGIRRRFRGRYHHWLAAY